jgi:transcriptional antiterminator RfaH
LRSRFYAIRTPRTHIGSNTVPAKKAVTFDTADARAEPADAQEPRWFLVHCKPREDGRALEHLERQGFECYRPAREVERHRDGRKYTITEALFPRYLFVRLDCVQDNWYPIRSTRGVDRVVRFNDYPAPVPNGVIDAIRMRLNGSSAREPYLKPGERVQITEGAFSQVEAIFVAADGDERVILLLHILQKDQKLTFPLHSVRKLK